MLSIWAIQGRGSSLVLIYRWSIFLRAYSQTYFPTCGHIWLIIYKHKKLTVKFSKEMLILVLRFYILNFIETKSVYSPPSDQ